MTVSVHITGIAYEDERWILMKRAYKACKAVKVDLPKEILDYFDGRDPGDMMTPPVDISEAVSEWGEDGKNGFKVDVEMLPEDLQYIKFYASY